MSPLTHAVDGAVPTRLLAVPNARLGLLVFIGVVTVLFGLLCFAWLMRMNYSDWRPLPAPPWQLWLSTSLLICSSIALQAAHVAAQRSRRNALQIRLLIGGICAFGFLAAQLWGWQQMRALNYLVAGNPANSFFYLISGLHGLHLLGGLAAWGRTGARLWRGAAVDKLALSVQLCAIYWHFLLALWLALFALLFLLTPAAVQLICSGF